MIPTWNTTEQLKNAVAKDGENGPPAGDVLPARGTVPLRGLSGRFHANGVKLFWSMLKRAHKGTVQRLDRPHGRSDVRVQGRGRLDSATIPATAVLARRGIATPSLLELGAHPGSRQTAPASGFPKQSSAVPDADRPPATAPPSRSSGVGTGQDASSARTFVRADRASIERGIE